MIRTNLSTRPFYNERAVRLVLLLIGLVALGATTFNVTRVIQLSHRDTELVTQASRDRTRVVELRASAARLRASVDPKANDLAAADARQANELIDRRTFSWTDLLNRFETTLPDDVRITAVRPKLDPKRGFALTIVVVAKGVDDVNQFIENLEATGAFAELHSADEHIDEQNQLEAALAAIYVPAPAHPEAEGAKR